MMTGRTASAGLVPSAGTPRARKLWVIRVVRMPFPGG